MHKTFSSTRVFVVGALLLGAVAVTGSDLRGSPAASGRSLPTPVDVHEAVAPEASPSMAPAQARGESALLQTLTAKPSATTVAAAPSALSPTVAAGLMSTSVAPANPARRVAPTVVRLAEDPNDSIIAELPQVILTRNDELATGTIVVDDDGGDPFSFGVEVAGTEAYFLATDRNLRPSSRPDGWGGHGERWFEGDDGLYFLTPTGDFYKWSLGQYGELRRFLGLVKPVAMGAHLATLPPVFFEVPELLTEPSAAPLATLLDERLGLRRTPDLMRDTRGTDEQWFVGRGGGQYFIDPEGGFHRVDDGPTGSAHLLATLHRNYHANPTLLADAVDVDIPAETVGDAFYVGPVGSGMAGPFVVRVTADNGTVKATQEFFAHAENYERPYMSVPGPQLLGVGEMRGQFQVHPGDADDWVEVSVNTAGSAAYFVAEHAGGFAAGDRPTDWAGSGEKWLRSPEGWFFITPNGALRKWDGTDRTASGELQARLEPVFYLYPELLTRPTAGSLASALDGLFSFSPTTTPARDSLDLGERWLRGADLTVYITPDGRLYRGEDSTFLADFDPIHHTELGRLYAPATDQFEAETSAQFVYPIVDDDYYGDFVIEVVADDGVHAARELVPVERRFVETGDLARVSGALAASSTTVVVAFTQAMNSSALDPANYEITQTSAGAPAAADVLRAEWSTILGLTDRTAVKLTTRPLSEVEYTVAVSNVRDLSGAPLAYPIDLSLADPTRATFTGRAPGEHDMLDSDGDGLFDFDEQRGWEVRVTAADGEVATRWVTSDPDDPDADGDDLTDYDEFLLNLDPRNPDTDRDHLTDYQEYNEIYSNPASVDSDEDGIDDFFEWDFYKTSPSDKDSDGDQIDDGEEALLANRNMRVADLPKPAIEVGSIDLDLDYRYNYTEGTEVSEGETQTVSETLTQSSSDSFSSTDSKSHEVAVKVAAEHEWKVGVENGVTNKVSGEVANTNSFSSSFTEASARAVQEEIVKSYESDRTATQEETVERIVEGARMSAVVTLKADSNIAFNIQNLRVSAFLQDSADFGTLVPIATLKPEEEPEGGFNLGPFSPVRGPLILKAVEIFPARVEQLMLDPDGIVFKISNYDLIDEDERNYAFSSQDVNDRTSPLVIDFGFSEDEVPGVSGTTERYRISTAGGRVVDTDGDDRITENDRRVAYDPNTGVGVGITITDALEAVLGLEKFNEDTKPWRELGQLELKNSYSTKVDDDGVEQLWRVREISRESDPLKKWRIFTETGILGADTSFSDLLLRPEAGLTFRFMQDLDDDALDAAAESLAGSSDSRRLVTPRGVVVEDPTLAGDAPGLGLDDYIIDEDLGNVDMNTSLEGHQQLQGFDSDLDGLPDSFEFFGGPLPKSVLTGWYVSVAGRPTYRAYASPARVDSDLDGLTDYDEWNRFVEIEVDGTNVRVRKPTDPQSYDTDGDGVSDFDEVNGFGVEHRTKGKIEVKTDPLAPDTDGDTLNDGQERTLGSDPTDPDAGTVLDDDRDGLVNFQEDSDQPEQGWLVKVVQDEKGYRVWSDPNNPDTDSDGLTDLQEYALRTDPTKPDTDGDKLNDFDEVNATWMHAGNSRPTDPLNADSDDDGRSDFDELRTPVYVTVDGVTVEVTTTDPNKADEDLDGLNDGKEVRIGTHPAEQDTDGDDVSDGDEDRRATNPLARDKLVRVTIQQVVLNGEPDDEGTSNNVEVSGLLNVRQAGSPGFFERFCEQDIDEGWSLRFGSSREYVLADKGSPIILENLAFREYDGTDFQTTNCLETGDDDASGDVVESFSYDTVESGTVSLKTTNADFTMTTTFLLEVL